MSEQLRGESTAQDEQAEIVARPSVSEGHFWINPYRSGSDLLAGSSTRYRPEKRNGSVSSACVG
jgi:hypothetical protein